MGRLVGATEVGRGPTIVSAAAAAAAAGVSKGTFLAAAKEAAKRAAKAAAKATALPQVTQHAAAPLKQVAPPPSQQWAVEKPATSLFKAAT